MEGIYFEQELNAAYASGRKDEREEWLPVLEALQGFLACWDACASPSNTGVIEQARAAIARVTGSGA